MPITTVKTDAAISDLMAASLTFHASGSKQEQYQSADLILAPPISVYSLRLRDLKLADYLRHAEHSGWIGLAIGHSTSVATRVHDVAKPRLSGLQYGWIAGQLLNAIDMAETATKENPIEFEIRLLEVPGLHLTFLWLHCDRDHEFFIAIGGVSVFDKGSAAIVPEIDSFVQAALERRDLNKAAHIVPISRDEEGNGFRRAVFAITVTAIIIVVAIVLWALVNA